MMTDRRTVVLGAGAAALAAGCAPAAPEAPAEAASAAVADPNAPDLDGGTPAPRPGAPDDPRPQAYELIGQTAPAFTFAKVGGGEASLSDYAGQVLILYFYGLWCPDCLSDAPNVRRLAERVGETDGVEFLALHTRGRYGRWGSVEAYFAEKGYSYPVAIDPSREFSKEVYKIPWYPSFLAIDAAGVIRAWRTDLVDEAGVEAWLAQAVALKA